jgi:hypothetical protein
MNNQTGDMYMHTHMYELSIISIDIFFPKNNICMYIMRSYLPWEGDDLELGR